AKYPWVQVPAGEIGVVIAQVGDHLPIGAKSAEYRTSFGDFRDVREFLADGGQKGLQRPVLPPGTLAPIHPVAFLVITSQTVYGEPVSPDVPYDKRGGDGPGGLRPGPPPPPPLHNPPRPPRGGRHPPRTPPPRPPPS